nr:glycosyltransferase [Helleborus thibetanus]
MDSKEHTLRVLMFPWLAHGHISPYLELAKKLSKRNLYIYLCSTPINLSSVEKHLDEKMFPSIQLVELHLPSLPNLPPHYHTTKSLPPHLMSTLMEAFDMAEPSFSDLLRVLKPDLLVYDYIQPWAPIAASHQNIPAVQFLTNSASFISYSLHMITNQNEHYPFPSVVLHEHEYRQLVKMFNKERDLSSCSNIILIKTFLEIEAKYMGYLALLSGNELVPVGPLVQEPTVDDDESGLNILKWLNEKDQSSVVFVSFGTEYFMSKEEIQEIAYGLELSKLNFIWVIRFPEGENVGVEEVLPQGFFERVKERGMVLKDWASQAKILTHSSVGRFVSHCGWSSVMEGLYNGVPVIAMPMHIDQPINARLVVELGAGIEIEKQDEKFVREELAKVVNEVVIEKKGEVIRKKAKELSEMMRRKGEEEINVVVEKFVQICSKSKNQV